MKKDSIILSQELKIKELTNLIDTIYGEIELTEFPQYATHEMVTSSIKDLIKQYHNNNQTPFNAQEINNPDNLKELREELISKMIEQNQLMGFYDNTPTPINNIIEE